MENMQFYESRLQTLNLQVDALKQKKKRFGMARLFSFLAAVLSFFILLEISDMWAVLSAIVFLTVFLIVTLDDISNLKKIKYKEQLIAINGEEIQVLNGDFSSFEDGLDFKTPEHAYANDLDIFGKHGLFQLINRTTTDLASSLLAGWLQKPVEKDVIGKRQKSVQALTPEVVWRQELQAHGRKKNLKKEDFIKIRSWAEENKPECNLNTWSYITTGAMILTATFIVLASAGLLSWKILWLSLVIHLWIGWRLGKVISPQHQWLSKTMSSLEMFGKHLSLFLTKDFGDSYLKSLQDQCYDNEQPAYKSISSLKSIMSRLDLRYNLLVHFPLNLIVFWDWHQYKQLQRWHEKNGEKLPGWMVVFAETEAMCSLANLAFNNPDWCFPEISDQHFTFETVNMGHPMIHKSKRVCNDAKLSGIGKLMLVTGSNMAGKSTFLRTVGVNVVLAMAGAPVCAEKMKVSVVQVWSSMRIADNLEENISTFYAELKKLEVILKQAKKHEKVLILLDEILRGTNSNDRYTGSRALIRQLLEEQAVGVLATHDLALTDMESTYPEQVMNHHFDVQVKQDELFFDYKLKNGICTSMNASLLMRKIGIDV